MNTRCCKLGWQWSAPLLRSKKVPSSNPCWGLSVWSVSMFSLCLCVGFFMILQLLLKNMHVRLIDDSTVAMDVMQTKMDGCMVKMRRSLKCFAQSVRLEMCYLYITLNMLCETQAASYEQHCDYHSNYD